MQKDKKFNLNINTNKTQGTYHSVSAIIYLISFADFLQHHNDNRDKRQLNDDARDCVDNCSGPEGGEAEFAHIKAYTAKLHNAPYKSAYNH